jgi:tripeptide aminopeptidase
LAKNNIYSIEETPQTGKAFKTEALLESFAALCCISGTSGNEQEVAGAVKEFAESLPQNYRIHEDEAGKTFGGAQGNLIMIPETHRPGSPSLALVAHMDTVRDTGATKFQVSSDRVHSAGTTQLGADNRWGLSLLLESMKHYYPTQQKDAPNLIFVATVAEEIGMLGAKALDLKPWNVKQAIVLDASLRPGSYIQKCAGMSLFEASFKGKAAHSAVAPEEGISAIGMAAAALSQMMAIPLPEDATANVGHIEGGGASNLIPQDCRFSGEVRGFGRQVPDILEAWRQTCGKAAQNHGGRLEFSITPDFEAFELERNSPLLQLMEQALDRAGLPVNPVTYAGGSDANALNAKGIRAVNMGIGAQKPHSDEEFVLLEDISACARMLPAILATMSLRSGL